MPEGRDRSGGVYRLPLQPWRQTAIRRSEAIANLGLLFQLLSGEFLFHKTSASTFEQLRQANREHNIREDGKKGNKGRGGGRGGRPPDKPGKGDDEFPALFPLLTGWNFMAWTRLATRRIRDYLYVRADPVVIVTSLAVDPPPPPVLFGKGGYGAYRRRRRR